MMASVRSVGSDHDVGSGACKMKDEGRVLAKRREARRRRVIKGRMAQANNVGSVSVL